MRRAAKIWVRHIFVLLVLMVYESKALLQNPGCKADTNHQVLRIICPCPLLEDGDAFQHDDVKRKMCLVVLL